MTKEDLEKGIIISREGAVRGGEFSDLQPGELQIKFSSHGTRSNFKPSKFVETSKNGVSVQRTMQQTTQEAACIVLYMGTLIDTLSKGRKHYGGE